MSKTNRICILLISSLLIYFLLSTPLTVKAQPWDIFSYVLTNSVTLDGQMTSADEWSDTIPTDVTLGVVYSEPPPTVSELEVRVWSKNDGFVVFFLIRVDLSGVDPSRYTGLWAGYVADIDYFPDDSFGVSLVEGWIEPRDFNYVDSTGPYPDIDVDTIGSATYDSSSGYFWCEFGKPMEDDINDEDWDVAQGDVLPISIRFFGATGSGSGDLYDSSEIDSVDLYILDQTLPTPSVPEFTLAIPIMTSLALSAYLLIKRKLLR